MVEVVNRQRRLQVNTEAWAKFAERAIEAIGHGDTSATIAFVSDRKIRELNRQFRAIDKATDVLSFPSESPADDLGDVAISVDTAAAQAKENDLSFENEIAQLILHGLLHLSGYDHETDKGEMNRVELRLRKSLGI